jgi:hypothetical protein
VRKTPLGQWFRERNNWRSWSQIHGVLSRKQCRLPPQPSAAMVDAFDFSACFTWGTGFKFVETNLDSFEANWILVGPCLGPCLGSWFFKLWANLFGSFPFRWNQLIFPPKCCRVGLASVYDFLVFDLHLKVLGVRFMTLIEYFDGPFQKNHDIFNISQIKEFSINMGLL